MAERQELLEVNAMKLSRDFVTKLGATLLALDASAWLLLSRTRQTRTLPA